MQATQLQVHGVLAVWLCVTHPRNSNTQGPTPAQAFALPSVHRGASVRRGTWTPTVCLMAPHAPRREALTCGCLPWMGCRTTTCTSTGSTSCSKSRHPHTRLLALYDRSLPRKRDQMG